MLAICLPYLLQEVPTRFGETQVVKSGPLAAPSRVFAAGMQTLPWNIVKPYSAYLCLSLPISAFSPLTCHLINRVNCMPGPIHQAGVYRIAAAVLTGAGNATIGLGGTVEGIASEVPWVERYRRYTEVMFSVVLSMSFLHQVTRSVRSHKIPHSPFGPAANMRCFEGIQEKRNKTIHKYCIIWDCQSRKAMRAYRTDWRRHNYFEKSKYTEVLWSSP